MLSPRGAERLEATQSNSFAIDLKKWRAIMAAYENGGHAYHATMPTDALLGFRAALEETRAMGFEAAKAAQWELGRRVRAMLAERGIRSVAAEGFAAPGVVVVTCTRGAPETTSEPIEKGEAKGPQARVGEVPDRGGDVGEVLLLLGAQFGGAPENGCGLGFLERACRP